MLSNVLSRNAQIFYNYHYVTSEHLSARYGLQYFCIFSHSLKKRNCNHIYERVPVHFCSKIKVKIFDYIGWKKIVVFADVETDFLVCAILNQNERKENNGTHFILAQCHLFLGKPCKNEHSELVLWRCMHENVICCSKWSVNGCREIKYEYAGFENIYKLFLCKILGGLFIQMFFMWNARWSLHTNYFHVNL